MENFLKNEVFQCSLDIQPSNSTDLKSISLSTNGCLSCAIDRCNGRHSPSAVYRPIGHYIADMQHRWISNRVLTLILHGSRHLGHVSYGHSIGHISKEHEQSISKLSIEYLTIIPRARMGYESIAHEAEGRMGYWFRAHEGERNNWIIVLVKSN